MENMSKFKKIGLFVGFLSVPWIYYFTIRKKLVEWEKNMESRLVNISDEDLLKMKKKHLKKGEISNTKED